VDQTAFLDALVKYSLTTTSCTACAVSHACATAWLAVHADSFKHVAAAFHVSCSEETMGGLWNGIRPVHIYPASRMVSNYSGMIVQVRYTYSADLVLVTGGLKECCSACKLRGQQLQRHDRAGRVVCFEC
jgi:hypothetical protein